MQTRPKSSLTPVLVSVDEFCQLTRLGRTRIYELIKNGEIKSRKIGHSRRIPFSEAERLAVEGEI